MRKRLLLSSLLGLCSLAAKAFGPYRQEVMDTARLKMSLLYIRGINVLRLLFVSLLGVGLCLMFLLGGIILLYTTLILYAPWSDQVKFYVNLACAVLYMGLSLGTFFYVFAHAKWLEMLQANHIVDRLSPESATMGQAGQAEKDKKQKEKSNGKKENYQYAQGGKHA